MLLPTETLYLKGHVNETAGQTSQFRRAYAANPNRIQVYSQYSTRPFLVTRPELFTVYASTTDQIGALVAHSGGN